MISNNMCLETVYTCPLMLKPKMVFDQFPLMASCGASSFRWTAEGQKRGDAVMQQFATSALRRKVS